MTLPNLVSEKLRPFGTTIFSEMAALARRHGALDLSQGYPDFEGPQEAIACVQDALASGRNQYARSQGALPLARAIGAHQARYYGLSYDPNKEIVVFSGATEGLMCTLLGLLNPEDEVIVFEPTYDSYPACIALAHAKARYLRLEFPDFHLDIDQLASLFSPKTRLFLLNTPHNPTGKVFSRAELEAIARLCIKHDVLVVTDEVYEHLSYDHTPHIPMATLDGMKARTLSISSAGKTLSFTGWKVGWATGPENMVTAAQAAHQFITFATATPLQEGLAAFLNKLPENYFPKLQAEYTQRRDLLLDALRNAGLSPSVPKGAYFILADYRDLYHGPDHNFARRLIEKVGIATIPTSGFYQTAPQNPPPPLVRFAFCKRLDTLKAAATRLRRLQETLLTP